MGKEVGSDRNTVTQLHRALVGHFFKVFEVTVRSIPDIYVTIVSIGCQMTEISAITAYSKIRRIGD